MYSISYRCTISDSQFFKDYSYCETLALFPVVYDMSLWLILLCFITQYLFI